MASTSSKAIPFVVLLIFTATIAADVFLDFEITESHVVALGALLSTLGLGGVYNGIRKGFIAARESGIREKLQG